ncbi:MAG: hypothetical protein QNL92_10370 [Octadecabacter sp.]
MGWLGKHAPSIEAIAAALTAIVAVAALIGIKVQLDSADRLQLEAAARESYRGHLALAVANPAFAAPDDGCEMLVSNQAGAYAAFVDHLLYSAELTLDADSGWEAVFLDELAPHGDYLCATDAPMGDTPEIIALLTRFRTTACPATPTCR